MKAFKFIVGSEFKQIPSDPRYSVSNCAAIVIAPTREEAIWMLADDLTKHGDVAWHEVATVTEITIHEDGAAVLLVVQG